MSARNVKQMCKTYARNVQIMCKEYAMGACCLEAEYGCPPNVTQKTDAFACAPTRILNHFAFDRQSHAAGRQKLTLK